MSLVGGSAAKTTATVSKAGSALSRSSSGVTKAIKSTSKSETTNEETAKDQGSTTAQKTTTTSKSEVLLTRLLNTGSQNTAQKLTQDAAADQAKWASLAQESALAPLKYQGAMANAQLLGSAFSAAGNLLGGLASKMGGKKKGGDNAQASASGKSGGASQQGNLEGGISPTTGTSATESLAKAAQADTQWLQAGAESSHLAAGLERDTNSSVELAASQVEAQKVSEDQSLQSREELKEVQTPAREIELAGDTGESASYVT